MSSNITDTHTTDSSDPQKSASGADKTTSPSSKGKEKVRKDPKMDEDEDDDDEEDDMGSDDDEDSEVEDSLEEIDPSAIVPQGRRTRGVRVDYTSKEALEKAGLQDDEGEESDEDVMMKD